MFENSIIYGDSKIILKTFLENYIDLTVTSPPYYNAKEYSQYECYNEYLEMLEEIFTQVYRVTKPSRMCVVNISPIIIPRESRNDQSYRIPIPYHFVPLMEKIGFEFLENIVWKKPNGAAVNRSAGFYQHRKPVAYKPNIVTEDILVFKKPASFLIDKVLKDEPITDFKIEWTNVWEMNPETKSDHPAPFPIGLSNRVITYYSYKNDIVLDPFAGSGTTLVSAKLLGRKYIGIELSLDYVNMTITRLNNVEERLL